VAKTLGTSKKGLGKREETKRMRKTTEKANTEIDAFLRLLVF
jgi:hypothetical protein